MTQPPPVPATPPPIPPATPAPLRDRRYGLEASLAGTFVVIGGILGTVFSPFVTIIEVFEGGLILTGLIACGLATALAVLIDTVIAKTANRQTRGLLFPVTAIIGGLGIGLMFAALAIIFVINLFSGASG